jgi:hypothetical protein
MNTYMEELYSGMNSYDELELNDVLLRITLILAIVILGRFILVKEKRRFVKVPNSPDSPTRI